MSRLDACVRSLRDMFSSLLSRQITFTQREWPVCPQRFRHTTSLQKRYDSESLPNWQLCAAVCVIRLPFISPNLTKIEERYSNMLEEQELERSVLSDWETEKMRQSEIIKAIEMGEKDTMDLDFKITHEDLEDDNERELKDFFDIETNSVNDADTTNVIRKMHDSLVHVVQKKLGNDEVWVLPSVPIEDCETMKECAERALSLHCPKEVQAKILSNAPCAFFKYKYPKKSVRRKSQDGYVGAKVFIYPAVVQAPQSVLATDPTTADSDILNYAWVTKDELTKYLKPKYFQAVKRILH